MQSEFTDNFSVDDLTKGLRLTKDIGAYTFQDPVLETEAELHVKYSELKTLASFMQNFDASAFQQSAKVSKKSQ
jgi:hypothetical protein